MGSCPRFTVILYNGENRVLNHLLLGFPHHFVQRNPNVAEFCRLRAMDWANQNSDVETPDSVLGHSGHAIESFRTFGGEGYILRDPVSSKGHL